MKKAGIITYHHFYNYGTMLQALALQELVSRAGMQAEVIDFYQRTRPDSKTLLQRRIRSAGQYILRAGAYAKKIRAKAILRMNAKNIQRRKDAFDAFYNTHFHLTATAYGSTKELLEKPPLYDLYITGSDQTWNPNVGGSPDAFFLTFAPSTAVRGSYAPSIAVAQLTHEQEDRFRRLLPSFQFLSCREAEGADTLSQLLHRPVTHVVDPTLLMDRSAWAAYEGHQTHKRPFLLQYFLGDNPSCRKFSKDLARRLDLPIVCLPANVLDMTDRSVIPVYGGPDAFLSLIRDASIVCTDSFHGTAFSVGYQKDFFSFCKVDPRSPISDNGRLHDFLHLLSLEDRLIADYDVESAIRRGIAIEYTKPQQLLQHMREVSQRYLNDMVNSVSMDVDVDVSQKD